MTGMRTVESRTMVSVHWLTPDVVERVLDYDLPHLKLSFVLCVLVFGAEAMWEGQIKNFLRYPAYSGAARGGAEPQ